MVSSNGFLAKKQPPAAAGNKTDESRETEPELKCAVNPKQSAKIG